MNAFNRLIERSGKLLGLDLEFFLKSGAWVTVRQVIATLAGFTTTILFTRFGGDELFGSYQFVLAVASILGIASLPGMNTSIACAAATGHDGSYKKATATRVRWSFIGLAAGMIAAIVAGQLQSAQLAIAIGIASIAIPATMGAGTWDAFLQGKGYFKTNSLWVSIQSIGSLIAIGSAILLGGGLVAVITAHMLLVSGFNVLYYFKSLRFAKGKKTDKETTPYGKFMTAIQIIKVLSGHIDKIAVGVLLGPVQLGVYSLGIYMSKRIFEIFRTLGTVMVPKIIKLKKISPKQYLLTFVGSSIVALVLYFIFPWAIPFIFSEAFSDAVRISQVLILFLPFLSVKIIYSNIIILHDKERKSIAGEALIVPTVKIGLMALLYTLFGLIGLAVAVGCESIISIATYYLLGKKYFRKTISAQ